MSFYRAIIPIGIFKERLIIYILLMGGRDAGETPAFPVEFSPCPKGVWRQYLGDIAAMLIAISLQKAEQINQFPTKGGTDEVYTNRVEYVKLCRKFKPHISLLISLNILAIFLLPFFYDKEKQVLLSR